MAFDLSIPAVAELAELPQWTNWKLVTRRGKVTKPPVQPSGRMAKSNDPTTWHSFEECAAASDKVGFVLEPPHIGIDLDGCRNPDTGAIDDWAREIIRDIASYTEVSPSGTGVKIIATADPMPELASNKLVIEKRADDKNKQIEVFCRDRYFCITGKPFRRHAGVGRVPVRGACGAQHAEPAGACACGRADALSQDHP